jgi:hypothetical protein
MYLAMCTVCIVCMCTAAVLFFKEEMTSPSLESDDKKSELVDAAPSCDAASLTPDDQRDQRNHRRWRRGRRRSSTIGVTIQDYTGKCGYK